MTQVCPNYWMLFKSEGSNIQNLENYRKYVEENFYRPYIYVVIYLFCVYFGKCWMKNRDPYNLRKPLAFWSGFLAIFSIIGFCRLQNYSILI